MGSHMFVCALDATAAFDSLSFITLFKKLLCRNMPIFIIRLLFFWYLNQKTYVRWNSLLSDKFCVTNGVKQGGILSPLLFNIYMDGLSSSLNEKAIGCFIKNIKFNHLMYADDIILFAPSVKGLQNLINVCYEYGASHGIIFNKAKTVCMHVLSNKVKWTAGSPCVKLGTERISFVKQITYLGHIICNDLSDDNYMLKQLRSLYCKANTLIRRFSQCSEKIRLLLFQMYCGTMYCCSLWCRYKKGTYAKLKVAYNNAFRVFMFLPKWCSASEMFVSRRATSFEALIRKS